MRWRKRDIRKVGIALAGLPLLLVLMVCIPMSANADEGTSRQALSGLVRTAPTVDVTATMTALNEEKLRQEIQQLKNQNGPDLLGLLRTNAAILLSTLVVVIGGLIGLFRWVGDQQDEREKRAEERFQKVVAGLGSGNEGRKVGAAIMLRTFLQPGYEQFYSQAFDLAVTYLRLRHVDPDTPEQIDPLSRALITAFKESFPKARDVLNQPSDFLDAAGAQLDNGYFFKSDLNHVWMRNTYLRDADLREVKMVGANLSGAHLNGTLLDKAILDGAILWEVDLSGANIEAALSLHGADLHGIKGLTKEQLEACKAKGAIIDEETSAAVGH